VYYQGLTAALGTPHADRVEGAATREQKAKLAALTAANIQATTLAGEPVTSVLSHAPGNGAAIGGIKVCTASGWFAARPSGTEDIYKVYAESFRDEAHLQQLLQEARSVVDEALAVT
jgi:phosphoglucomutase